MKWFFRWLGNRVEQAHLEDEPYQDTRLSLNKILRKTHSVKPSAMAMEDSEVRRISSNGMRFELYRGDGGWIVETSVYDSKTDRNQHSLHIITDGQDIGERMGQIITLQALRR